MLWFGQTITPWKRNRNSLWILAACRTASCPSPTGNQVIWKKTQGPTDPDTQCCLPRARLMNSLGCHLWGWAELKSNPSWISRSLRVACFRAVPATPGTQAKPNAYVPSAIKRNKSILSSKESHPTSAEWDQLRLTFNLTLINTSSAQLFYYFPKNGRALAVLHRNQALNEFIAILHTSKHTELFLRLYVQRTQELGTPQLEFSVQLHFYFFEHVLWCNMTVRHFFHAVLQLSGYGMPNAHLFSG